MYQKGAKITNRFKGNPKELIETMKTALVTPAVDFDAMEEVFILCGIGDGE
ncbi:MAG: hypothetical protein FWG40_12350 [Peptococcaceae bacterium]|nr:hypothetical protein [Peptococcaceae bacterium]